MTLHWIPQFVPVFYAFQGLPGGFRRQGKPQADHQWRALAAPGARARRCHACRHPNLSTSEWCIHFSIQQFGFVQISTPQPWQTKVIITVSSMHHFWDDRYLTRGGHLWIYHDEGDVSSASIGTDQRYCLSGVRVLVRATFGPNPAWAIPLDARFSMTVTTCNKPSDRRFADERFHASVFIPIQ